MQPSTAKWAIGRQPSPASVVDALQHWRTAVGWWAQFPEFHSQ